jgi:hypothetical protein
MRYFAALVVSSLLVGAFLAYRCWVSAKVDVVLRRAQEEARQVGLPSEVTPGDFGLLMSKDLMTLVEIDHLILKFWFVVLPLILFLCFGVAAIVPRKHVKAGLPATSPIEVDPRAEPKPDGTPGP